MRRLLLLIAVAACAAACGDSESVPPQRMLNPGGKPRTAQEQANMDLRRSYGEKMNQSMSRASQQMEAARSRAAK